MFCPQCGQEQLSDEVRFCSRCGFALTEVTGLLARRGVPEVPSARRRGLKQGAFIIAATLGLILLLAATNADGDAAIVFATLGFMAGILRMLYALVFQRQKGRQSLAAPVTPPAVPVPMPREALPPAYTPPAAPQRGRFDTGEIVQPPSVTEHTTRHLQQEPPRERES